MKRKIAIGDMQELIGHMSSYMDTRRAELAELDSLTGDGDMGVTIALIFRSSVRYARSIDDDLSFSQFFDEISEVVGENAPSTFGTFVATMLKSISDHCGDMTEIGAREYADILGWAAEGVMKRGGAKLGDKTLLDALIPAGEAAKATDEDHLYISAKAAAQAAARGAENTCAMKATTGRAGYMGERTIGSKDPGAAAIAEILTSFLTYVEG